MASDTSFVIQCIITDKYKCKKYFLLSGKVFCSCFLTDIARILRQKSSEISVKKYCIDYLDSIGSFAYTREVLFDLEHR